MYKEIVNKRRKRTSFRDVDVNKTLSKSLQFNFYVVLQPATRSSRSQMFFKIGVLKGFSKFIGKHLYQSLSFNKVVGVKPATLLKKRLWGRCFSVNIAKCLEHLLSQGTSGG